MVEDPEFVFDIPGAWLEYMFIDTEIDGPGEDYPSDWIVAAYPNARCWLAAALAEPPSYQVLPLPGRIGFFRIRAARDGCIGFVLDGANCYWQRWGGGSGTFEDPGETCPPFPCDGPSAVRKDCWGSLKRMFR